MIRSNPTAIPLRPSDLKLLQRELDARRDAAALSAAGAASASAAAASAGKDKAKPKASKATAHANGSSATTAAGPADAAVEEPSGSGCSPLNLSLLLGNHLAAGS
ncbi:uncharacterized protein LOC62_03G004529 [Vanrija pseudolonga]|uniref:Uncharacterized protein n=1 Tax=Vanrija pseudolonga TaxID=143232 RepID=A0AAF0YAU8_9TREE|nr:hypothetical protein LOC62_03G004529 [Vanrija pseudolonga]